VNAVDSSAAVLTAMPRSLAIFGTTGSTARVNSVEAKMTRLTMRRTGGITQIPYQTTIWRRLLRNREKLRG
jgi:hypothetical protein